PLKRAARGKASKKKKRSAGRWKLGGALIALVGMAGLACAAYVLYLDRLVTSRFEGLRWTLPAHVYAAPMDLYAGLDLSQPQLEHELLRLSYHRVADLQ